MGVSSATGPSRHHHYRHAPPPFASAPPASTPGPHNMPPPSAPACLPQHVLAEDLKAADIEVGVTRAEDGGRFR